MKLSDVDPGHLLSKQLEKLASYVGKKSLWQDELQDVLTRTKQDHNTDSLLQLLHETQRLDKIYTAGLETDAAFRYTCLTEKFPLWNKFTSPDVEMALQESLAKKLYNIRPGKNDVGAIRVADGARDIGKWLVEKCLSEKVPFLVQFTDDSFNALVLNHATEQGIKNLAADYVVMNKSVARIMTARAGTPDKPPIAADKDKQQLYSREIMPFSNRVSSGELFYTLTEVPTKADAAIDGIEYKDYLKLFFEMCDQPWDAVGLAQKQLIAEFNAASKVRITNNDGTDVSMSLVDHDGSHFTFCNSLIAKNVPGSEIFSAPRLDSVEGVVVAKGRFSHAPNEIVENLRLEFEKGRLVRYSAEKGLEHFEAAIGVDDGAKFVGELGIGTNPHLKQHVANGLLVEKIGGSFHLALGRPYSYTEYEGESVKVNNGGESALHWDITTMLQGKDGKIYLDDRLVMDNGKWLDNKYDVLNRGWAAIPEAERPDYWKSHFKKQPQPKS